jgi:hypothetical protein
MKALLRRLQKLEEEVERLEDAKIQLRWVNPKTGEQTDFSLPA